LERKGPQLVFLKKAERGGGYFVLQHPGTLVAWTKHQRQILEPLLPILATKKGKKERAKLLLALALGKAAPKTRALALLSLCRSGGMQHASASQRNLLRQALEREGTARVFRDLCARALAGLRDPSLPNLLLRLLRNKKASGLGRCFGALLQQNLGRIVARERLRSLLQASPGDSELKAALGQQ
jgi:hypothetical protein